MNTLLSPDQQIIFVLGPEDLEILAIEGFLSGLQRQGYNILYGLSVDNEEEENLYRRTRVAKKVLFPNKKDKSLVPKKRRGRPRKNPIDSLITISEDAWWVFLNCRPARRSCCVDARLTPANVHIFEYQPVWMYRVWRSSLLARVRAMITTERIHVPIVLPRGDLISKKQVDVVKLLDGGRLWDGFLVSAANYYEKPDIQQHFLVGMDKYQLKRLVALRDRYGISLRRTK